FLLSPLAAFTLYKVNHPPRSDRPPNRPHRLRKRHRLQLASRQPLRPKRNPLAKKQKLRQKRVRPLQVQRLQGARPRKQQTRPHRGGGTVSSGLIRRRMFTTGRARVFTARRGRANT